MRSVPSGSFTSAFARADAGTARLLYDLGGGEAIALVGCAAIGEKPGDWDFSNSFRPSLSGGVLSCTGGEVMLGSLSSRLRDASFEINPTVRTILSVVTIYENRSLVCAFSTSETGRPDSSKEITRIAIVDEGVLRLERMPGDIHIHGRWAYYDG